MSAKRVIIVGAKGRLGRALVKQLSDGFEVVGLGREEMDLTSKTSIRACLSEMDFDEILLPASLTNVDYCEDHEDEAYAVNSEAPAEIALLCAQKGARLTYFSTDFVFDGKTDSPYVEEDEANPLSVYGASKLSGENEVLKVSGDHLIIRLSWLYGSGCPAFPEWIIDQAVKQPELSLPEDKVGCPSASADIAGLTERLLFGAKGVKAARGIYHLANSGSCTWKKWGQTCIDLARELGAPIKTDTIQGNSLSDIAAFKALRPQNSAMSVAKFEAFTGVSPRPWKEALESYLRKEVPLMSSAV